MTTVIGTAWLDEMLDEYWSASTVHAYLLVDGSLFSPTLDKFLADIPGGDRLVGPVVVTGKINLGGYFTDNPISFTLGDGDVAEWLVVVRVDATEATSPIIGFTNVYEDNVPLNSVVGNGGVLQFSPLAQGLGRI